MHEAGWACRHCVGTSRRPAWRVSSEVTIGRRRSRFIDKPVTLFRRRTRPYNLLTAMKMGVGLVGHRDNFVCEDTVNCLSNMLGGLLAFCVAASGLQGQPTGRLLCAPCRIEVTPLARLGDESGSGMIDHIESRAIRSNRGEYVVKSNYPTSLALFDRSGKFIRTIGRKGSGPGEFQGIGAIAFGEGDSLHVFDQVAHRYSVLDPAYRFVRSGTLPLGPELASLVLPTGDYVFGLPLRTPAQIGQPLHRVDRMGKLTASFGSQSATYRPDIPYFDRRAIAPAKDGLVWSAYRTQYVLERWNPVTGKRVAEMRRDVAWFPSRMSPPRQLGEAADSDAPEPFLMAVRESADGILWVLIAVPDKDWKRAIAARRNGQGHTQVQDEQRYYDTVLEALNPQTGQFLASITVPEFIRQFVADDAIGTVVEDSDGLPKIHLWRVALKPK